jgi:FMN phosphatase YigB (HAD superfamily)
MRDEGSPAARADALQTAWSLPWQWTDLAPENGEPVPAVVAEDGALHRDGLRWAWAVAARPPGRAVAEVVAADEEAAEAARRAGAERLAEGRAQLWRLDRERGCAEPAAPERVIRPRPALDGPVAVLCDLGRVLVDFDHGLIARNYELLLGKPLPEEARRLLPELLHLIERGALPMEDFFERAFLPLRLSRLDRALFRRLWCSILFPLPAGAAWARRLSVRPRLALTVVSNIDPWRLNWVKERLGLEDLCRYAVASYEDGVRPKHEDASMWQRALDFCRMRLGEEPAAVLVLDDTAANLETARAAGIGTRHVQVLNPSQMWLELGAAGLYLPLARQAAGR